MAEACFSLRSQALRFLNLSRPLFWVGRGFRGLGLLPRVGGPHGGLGEWGAHGHHHSHFPIAPGSLTIPARRPTPTHTQDSVQRGRQWCARTPTLPDSHRNETSPRHHGQSLDRPPLYTLPPVYFGQPRGIEPRTLHSEVDSLTTWLDWAVSTFTQ